MEVLACRGQFAKEILQEFLVAPLLLQDVRNDLVNVVGVSVSNCNLDRALVLSERQQEGDLLNDRALVVEKLDCDLVHLTLFSHLRDTRKVERQRHGSAVVVASLDRLLDASDNLLLQLVTMSLRELPRSHCMRTHTLIIAIAHSS